MDFNLADLFECVADAVPDREAMIAGNRRLTFAELDARANRCAHVLQASGIKPGDHVGLYLYNGTEYMEASLALHKIRAVPVNINWRYVEDELRYLFTDAQLKGLVFQQEFGDRAAGVGGSLPAIRTFSRVADASGVEAPGIDARDYETAIASASPARDFAARSPDDLYIVYTGGTTGMPKGVMWRQEDVFFGGLQGGNVGGPPIEEPQQIADVVRSRVGPTMLPVAPLMHGNGNWSAFIGLFGGGKVVLSPGRFDATRIWQLVQDEKVNVLSIVGDAMARPLAEALSGAAKGLDVSSLAVISSGGAIFSTAVKDEIRAHLPTVLLVDAFGVSESGHQGMTVTAGAAAEGPPRFMVDATTAVLGDDLMPLPNGTGAIGRLARKGRLPLGYFNDPVKTAATFVTGPDGTRWSLPGDMATIETDGTVTLLGRGSICINSGGEKIFPEEVEAALKSHPAVFDAVVVGVADERWGERVTAVVQPRVGASVTLADLDAHCRTKVSGYKVPRALHVVLEISRSPSGKADYGWAKNIATTTEAVTA